MFVKKKLFMLVLFLSVQSMCTISLKEQFNQAGYVEICDKDHGTVAYDSLYQCFDEFIIFLQKNPTWAQKLYGAKERFIRSKERHYYSTDFVGFYDESNKRERSQIAFYYSVHFHDFLFSQYQEFKQALPIINFFELCYEIQKSTADVFNEAAAQLGVENIFFSPYAHIPLLLKVVKYLPSYSAAYPHYDGTAFSLFLDSTDNESLLLSAYKSVFMVEDFFPPLRNFGRSYNQNSILLIPGTWLTEFSIYPTPHIVHQSGKIRYATIAFAMRPNYTSAHNNFPILPSFKS